MSNIFKQTIMPRVGQNRFDLSHDVKMSFDMGELIPSCIMEVLPGDKMTINVENMLRFAPLVSPVMHKVDVTTHFFFVPNRILWSEWEDFITGESSSVHPYVQSVSGVSSGKLGDYLGLPQTSGSVNVSAFPIAAYMKIYDEYYRDQNLQTEKFDGLVAGYNANENTAMVGAPYRRNWNHDYFTSCLPWAQKGDQVTLPLLANDVVDVELKTGSTNPSRMRKASDQTDIGTTTGYKSGADSMLESASAVDAQLDPNGNLEVDFTGEATDLNTVRRAFRLQEWLEKNARGGTRYIEQLLSHFGVKSSDKRMQRPEYIGGAKQNMVISEVLTTADSGTLTVGDLAGHGISVGTGNKFNYRAEEHGIIMGIISVMPRTAYSQGIHKSWLRTDKLDYAWPTFANIGEQAVQYQELYATTGSGTDLTDTFGYIPRYSEYKFMNSRVAGDFKDSLDHWHLARQFPSKPSLNDAFITCTPRDDIFVSATDDTILAHVFNNVTAIRKLPKFGIPSI